MRYNPDPYDFFEDEGEDMPVIGFSGDEHPNEKGYFEEIVGWIQGCPNKDSATYENELWDEFNKIMDSLVQLGHADYIRFKMTPQSGQIGSFMSYSTYKMKLMAAARKLTQDFGFGDLNYILYHDAPRGGTSIANHVESNPIMNSTQTNAQNTNLGISVQQLEESLGETLSDQQLTEIKSKIDKFANEPKKWVNAESLIKGALGFGKEAGLLVLRAVLDKYMP